MAYISCNDTVLERFMRMMEPAHRKVEIITRNGYHMFGYIVDSDDRALLVEVAGTERLVMMDAVSTIIPAKEREGSGDVG